MIREKKIKGRGKPRKRRSVAKRKNEKRKRKRRVHKYPVLSGIENLTKLHTLRHTFSGHLIMQGVDLPIVKKLMCHSDIQTTMIYAHLSPDHLADAVDRLELE
ncbi:MAG: tyrosine-type recombinase/integrase [candidate division Zixibacteria bacterium]|nr:tyrosine-type recombinase/integrase [candidate division Zixibacteria bacterium]